MKYFTLLFILFFSLQNFSQKTVELDLSTKEYKKINKKLDLKIVNRGYDGSGKIWISDDFSEAGGENSSCKYYKFLWEEAFFEMNLDLGEITSETSTERIIDADWIIKFTGGYSKSGYSGEILDFRNNKKVVTTFKA